MTARFFLFSCRGGGGGVRGEREDTVSRRARGKEGRKEAVDIVSQRDKGVISPERWLTEAALSVQGLASKSARLCHHMNTKIPYDLKPFISF